MRNRTLVSNLLRLQVAQYHHDQTAHQDILGLLVPRRLTHFTLHFSKYVGSLAKAHRQSDEQLKRRVITDSLVIALAAANALGVDLQQRIESGAVCDDTAAFNFDNRCGFEPLILCYAEVVGEMSKACEALDHLEDYPFRSVMERDVVLLIPIISRFAEVEGIDLAAAVIERWKMIEQKHQVCWDNGSTHELSRVSVAA